MSEDYIINEKYIEHEIKIRVMKEVNDDKFIRINQDIAKVYEQLNRKANIIMAACGAIFTTVIIPVVLHSLKLV